MPKLKVYNMQGQESGSIDLPDTFSGDVNKAVLHQSVVMYQANQRQGNADTKTRSQVSGGNKKPFRQKGTGRARQGSSRSPLMRHGGIVFGPHPRDFSYVLPQKVRTAALRESLKDKFQADALICIDSLNLASGKTKDFLAVLKNVKASTGKVLALFEGCGDDVLRASRNISRVNRLRVKDVNALDVLKNSKILATKSAMEQLLKRLQ